MNNRLDRFLETGEGINERDEHGRTLLMFYAYFGLLEAVKCLVVYGADINAKDNKGQTALDWASKVRIDIDLEPHLKVVNFLESIQNEETTHESN